MRFLTRALPLVLVFVMPLFGVERPTKDHEVVVTASNPTPQELLKEGVTLLKEEKLVEAVKVLAKASEAFQASGNEERAAEANSLLYWAKKRMTLAQANALAGDAKVAKVVQEVVEKKVDPKDAKVWLVRANEYARNTTDPLLKAVRYFEVADRFKGTPEGFTALDQSLKLMKMVSAKPKTDVVGSAERGDGKVYVQSDPRGATILVRQGGELRDTGLRTPGLVRLPKGPAKLVLRKDKYEDATVEAVAGDAIVKTDVVKLEKPKFDVEVTTSAEMGDGWMVFADGKPLIDKEGQRAMAPCTVCITEETRILSLAKLGFCDQNKRIENQQKTILFSDTPRRGQTRLIRFRFKTSCNQIPLKDGQRLYTNRDYTLIDVPKKYEGWTLLQGIASSPFDVDVYMPMTVFFAKDSTRNVRIPKGLNKTGERVGIKVGQTIHPYDVYVGTTTELRLPNNTFFVIAVRP